MVKDEKVTISKEDSDGIENEKNADEENDDAVDQETPSQSIPKVEEKPRKEIGRAKRSDQGNKGFPEFDALIFMCSRFTYMDCFKYGVFGLPEAKKHVVEQVRQGMLLFLFDIEKKLLYGVFRAASRGGFKLEPAAYKESRKEFPWQVRFIVYKECLPLLENVLKEAIKENYTDEKKFKIELTGRQAQKLMKLFRPAPTGQKVFPLFPKPAPAQVLPHEKSELAVRKGAEELKVSTGVGSPPSHLDPQKRLNCNVSPSRHSTRERSRSRRDKSPARDSMHDRSPRDSLSTDPASQEAKASTPDRAVQENQASLTEAPQKHRPATASITYSADEIGTRQDVAPYLSPLQTNTGILEPCPSGGHRSIHNHVNTGVSGPFSSVDLHSLHNPAYHADFNTHPALIGPQNAHSRHVREPLFSTGSVAAQGVVSSDFLQKSDPYGLNLELENPDPYGLGLNTGYKTNPYHLDLEMRYRTDPYHLGSSLYNYGQGIAAAGNLVQGSLYNPLPQPPLPDVRGGVLGGTYKHDPSLAADGPLSYRSSLLGKRPYQDTYLSDLGGASQLTRLPPLHNDSVLDYQRRLPHEEGARIPGSLQYSGSALSSYMPSSSLHYNRVTLPPPQPPNAYYNETARPYNRGLW